MSRNGLHAVEERNGTAASAVLTGNSRDIAIAASGKNYSTWRIIEMQY